MAMSFLTKNSKISNSSVATKTFINEAELEILRIALKKEKDRQQRMEKLFGSYKQIHGQVKNQIKLIKSSAIELKDMPQITKMRYLVDPSIYVDNTIDLETRKLLCNILNSFYGLYAEATQHQKKSVSACIAIKRAISEIQQTELKLFELQKTNINCQVEAESSIMAEASKLKEQESIQKELLDEDAHVSEIYQEESKEYEIKLNAHNEFLAKINSLDATMAAYTEEIRFHERISEENKQKIAIELMFQERFEVEKQTIETELQAERRRFKQLQKQVVSLVTAKGKKSNIPVVQSEKNARDMISKAVSVIRKIR